MTGQSPESAALVAEVSTRLTAMERDLGEIKTACAVLVARSTRTEQDVRDLRADMESEFAQLREHELIPIKADIAATKARQWPLPSVAAVTAIGALVVSLWQAIGK